MRYPNICRGEFLERPNRFVARVLLEDHGEVVCHVKNTRSLRRTPASRTHRLSLENRQSSPQDPL